MAFIVQCPFCQFRATAPDRALGAAGRCPKCASAFTVAPLDDTRLPESASAALEAEAEPVKSEAMEAAIAAAAAVANAPPSAEPLADAPHAPKSKRQNLARVGGALAIFLSGLALAAGAVPLLHPFVRVLAVLAFLAGLTGIVLAARAARRRMLLPLFGTAAASAVLIVVWFFPALLGPAYEFSRRRPEPTPVGLHALPLGGAPKLAEVPEWTDAHRYALRRDALRVQVIRFGLLPPARAEGQAPKERFIVSVRVSSDARDATAIERDATFAPTLTDDAGKSHRLLQTEFLDFGGPMPGAYLVPTIEETFVFESPAKGWKTLRLELPAERWRASGPFRFAIQAAAQGLQSKR